MTIFWFRVMHVLPQQIRSHFATAIIGAKLLIDSAAARNKLFNVLDLLFLVVHFEEYTHIHLKRERSTWKPKPQSGGI